ncbi:MaoC family dehydratase [Nitratireductor soli]|uniref:MaoC family dehydratase n=1 Tax=Nitratireductor soli TaxID=1670619 RepID=UPI00065DD3A4|nr:MaoC family dehydratase [Nitratireductor soli]
MSTGGGTRTRRLAARYGRYLEEFSVGDVYEHFPGRTITEADNIQMSLLTMNQHPLHCDAAYAATTEFGRPLVNSGLSLAVVLGITVADVSGKAVANLGWKEINLTGPVFCGDTLRAESQVLDVRPSRSRPGHGIVTVQTRAVNQHGTPVMDFIRSCLVPSQSASIGHGGSET